MNCTFYFIILIEAKTINIYFLNVFVVAVPVLTKKFIMASTKLSFHGKLLSSDPQQKPVLIIGQVKHLAVLKFEDVKCKLDPRVPEEVSYCYYFILKNS